MMKAEDADKFLPIEFELTLNEYQEIISVFDQSGLESYGNGSTPLWYYMLGLAGETGEMVDKVKKLYRNSQSDVVPEEKRIEMGKELGDVLWYLGRAAKKLGFSLGEIATLNVQKLADRARRGVIRSEGDNR